MSAPDQRASDSERQATVDALGEHAMQGRLTLEEFEERAEQAYRAVTVTDLAVLTRDLPALGTVVTQPVPDELRIRAVLLDETRTGRWVVGERLDLLAALGDVKVDLRDAALPAHLEIEARAILGDVRIYVPAAARVELTGTSILGSRKLRGGAADRPGATGPLIRVNATAVLGDVIIDVETPAERMKEWLGRLGS